ncbi:hypothetical protein ALT721_1190018 [Alteromonas alvinellae]
MQFTPFLISKENVYARYYLFTQSLALSVIKKFHLFFSLLVESR